MRDRQEPSEGFATTRWTRVLAARGTSPDAKAALRDLCQTYYAPVERFIRGYCGEQEARDRTHDFFAKLLEGNGLGGIEPTRGRFRSYLLGAVKHFLADWRDGQRAARRGGGQLPLSLDSTPAHFLGSSENGCCPITDVLPDPRGGPPDAFFDRHWALTLIEQAMATLQEESAVQGETKRFEVLKAWLITPAGEDTSLQAARTLNMAPNAFRAAVHRLRKRFRFIVKKRIAETVQNPEEIDEELRYLVSVLAFTT